MGVHRKKKSQTQEVIRPRDLYTILTKKRGLRLQEIVNYEKMTMKYLGLLVGDKDYLNNVVSALASCRLSSGVALVVLCDAEGSLHKGTRVSCF